MQEKLRWWDPSPENREEFRKISAVAAGEAEEKIAAEIQALFGGFKGTDLKAICALSFQAYNHANACEFDEAIAKFEKALEMQAGNPWVLKELILIRMEIGATEQAIQVAEKLFAAIINITGPDKIKNQRDYCVFLCGVYMMLKLWDEDLEVSKRATELDPEDPNAARHFATAWLKLKKYPQALEALKRYVKLNPKDPWGWGMLGAAYMFTGNIDESIRATKQSLQMYSREPGIWNNLGYALQKKGDLEGAKKAYENTLALDPNFASASQNLTIVKQHLSSRKSYPVTYLESLLNALQEKMAQAVKFYDTYANVFISLKITKDRILQLPRYVMSKLNEIIIGARQHNAIEVVPVVELGGSIVPTGKTFDYDDLCANAHKTLDMILSFPLQTGYENLEANDPNFAKNLKKEIEGNQTEDEVDHQTENEEDHQTEEENDNQLEEEEVLPTSEGDIGDLSPKGNDKDRTRKIFSVSHLESLLSGLRIKNEEAKKFYDTHANYFLSQGITKDKILRVPQKVELYLKDAIDQAHKNLASHVLVREKKGEPLDYDFWYTMARKALEIFFLLPGEETGEKEIEENQSEEEENYQTEEENENHIEDEEVLQLSDEGIALMQSGRPLEAERKFRETIRKNPQLWQVWYNFSFVLSTLGQLEEEEQALRKVIALNSSFSAGWNNLGFFLEQKGDQLEAERMYNEAIKLDPNNYLAWHNLGVMFRKQGRIAEAEKASGTAFQLNPNDPDVWFSLALVYIEKKDYHQANEITKEALSKFPGNTNLQWLVKSLAAHDKGEVNLHEIFQKQRSGRRQTPRPESISGVKIIKLTEGVHTINVVNRNPGPHIALVKELHLIPSVNVFIEEGILPPEAVEGIRHAKEGDLAVAESMLWEVIHQNPENMVNRQNYIILLMKQGRLDEAETELRKILSSQPRNGRIRLLLGHVLHELGRKEEARTAYMLGISDSETIDVCGAINLNLYEDEPFKNNMIAFTDEERR